MVSATIVGAILAAVIFALVLEILLKPDDSAPKRKRSDAVPLMQPRAAFATLAPPFDTLRTSRS